MESHDSLPVLTDLDFDFPTVTPSTLGQPIEPIVAFLSPTSITIPSNPASPDEQSDSVSTTQGLSTNCSTTTTTIDQLQPPTISSSVDARSKITSSRKEGKRSKQKLAVCSVLPAKTIIAANDSQLPNGTRENTSLDSREL